MAKTYTRKDFQEIWGVAAKTVDRRIKGVESIENVELGSFDGDDARIRVFSQSDYQLLVKYHPVSGNFRDVDQDYLEAEIVDGPQQQTSAITAFEMPELRVIRQDLSEQAAAIAETRQETSAAQSLLATVAHQMGKAAANRIINGVQGMEAQISHSFAAGVVQGIQEKGGQV